MSFTIGYYVASRRLFPPRAVSPSFSSADAIPMMVFPEMFVPDLELNHL